MATAPGGHFCKPDQPGPDQTFFGPRMIGVLRGTQPVSLDGLGRVLRFWSRFLRLSGDCHLRLFSSGQPGMGGMGSPVQWVRTFFGLQIDGHDQRNPMVFSVSL